jgi:hypothetical protein
MTHHTTQKTTKLLADGFGVEDEQNGLLVVSYCGTKMNRSLLFRTKKIVDLEQTTQYILSPFFCLIKEKCRGCVFLQAEVCANFGANIESSQHTVGYKLSYGLRNVHYCIPL